MDISVRQGTTLTNGDQRWISGATLNALRHSTSTITLARSLFDLVTAFPNGFIPSGVVLGRVTAAGATQYMYGPYGGRASEVQTIGLGAASAGTVTITFDGATTAAIAYNANAAAVQTALEALPNLAPGDVTVTGGPLPGVVTLTFGGARTGANVPEITATPTGLTGGTITIATTTQGGGAVTDGRQTPVGFLLTDVPYDRGSTANMGAALLWQGEIYETYLPTGHGLDAAARVDLASKFRLMAVGV